MPAPHTDFIYAVIVDELGLFGAGAVIVIYALFAARGFKTALLAQDGFSKLLRHGAHRGVRPAGVRDRRRGGAGDSADGVTLPFVSYGGSSVVANMVLSRC